LTNAISPAGATGFWQFMKATAKESGLTVNEEIDERYNPIKSTYAACIYLKNAHKRLGSWTNVAASYNMGIAGVSRRLKSQGVSSYYDLLLNTETARYVFRILAIKHILENKVEYGFDISEEGLYEQAKLRNIKVLESIKDLAFFAKKHNSNYKLLKRHNPWLRKNKLTLKKGQSYTIFLPQTR